MPEPQFIEESVFINNAGLVICWPFISKFFEMAGLEDIKEEEQAIKGVYLLQYLVYGQINTPESELILNKLLCGLELDTPINQGIEVKAEEQKLCKQMLSAITLSWSNLQKTSHENFQMSFLQREGKITETENAWLLEVAKKPYDVLLQKLPWSLTAINFKWMDKKIEVEWL